MSHLETNTLSALRNYFVYKENTGLLFHQGIPGLVLGGGRLAYVFNAYWGTFQDLIYPGFKQLCQEHRLTHRLEEYWLDSDGLTRRISYLSSIKTSDMVRVVIMVWGSGVRGERDFTPV
jgi:hypothetical protein